jgi:hypothetical protein
MRPIHRASAAITGTALLLLACSSTEDDRKTAPEGGAGAESTGGSGGAKAGSGGARANAGAGGTGAGAGGTTTAAGGASSGTGGNVAAGGSDAGQVPPPDASADSGSDASAGGGSPRDATAPEASPPDAAPCDDANPDTIDEVHPVYGCGHRKGTWITFDSGLEVDTLTGYGWSPIAFNEPYDYFATHCSGLVLAGISTFHFATIDEVRTLAGGCTATASGGSCPLADPSCLNHDCGFGSACGSCLGGSGPHAGGTYCRPDVATCQNLWSASVCPNCTSPDVVWTYGATNGNFIVLSNTQVFHGRCVTTTVPNL